MKRKIILGGGLLGAIAVILGGYGFYEWSQRPVVSTVNNQDLSGVLSANTVLEPLETSLFTTKVPDYMHKKSSSESQKGPVIASYLLSNARQEFTDQTGITVGRLGSDALSEVSGVKLRLSQPEIYEQANLGWVPEGAVVFSRKDEYEKSIFWKNNARYVSVVVSGLPARQAELDQQLSAIVQNWQWR
jgi:hypothetical protein